MRDSLLGTISGQTGKSTRGSWRLHFLGRVLCTAWLAALVVIGSEVKAQVNVLTAHNDIARTGQNLNETILTPSNVNPTQFGKLFSQQVTGAVNAQPLYVSQLAIPGKGTHNVVYVATAADVVYAFDADTNGGANATPLWQTSLLTNTTPAGTFQVEWGVIGTPVIDLSSNTMYLVSSETQTATATEIFRLHALDITTGAEKFGGPFQIQGSVPGTGTRQQRRGFDLRSALPISATGTAPLERSGVRRVCF